jgi:hypothetical protein
LHHSLDAVAARALLWLTRSTSGKKLICRQTTFCRYDRLENLCLP